MKDFKYYTSSSVVIPARPLKKDYTLYNAILKDIDGNIVDNKYIFFNENKKFVSSGYIIKEHFNETVFKQDDMHYAMLLKMYHEEVIKHEIEFEHDISTHFKISLEDAKSYIEIAKKSFSFFIEDAGDKNEWIFTECFANEYDVIYTFIYRILIK